LKKGIFSLSLEELGAEPSETSKPLSPEDTFIPVSKEIADDNSDKEMYEFREGSDIEDNVKDLFQNDYQTSHQTIGVDDSLVQSLLDMGFDLQLAIAARNKLPSTPDVQQLIEWCLSPPAGWDDFKEEIKNEKVIIRNYRSNCAATSRRRTSKGADSSF
jgi:hypothetical protein